MVNSRVERRFYGDNDRNVEDMSNPDQQKPRNGSASGCRPLIKYNARRVRTRVRRVSGNTLDQLASACGDLRLHSREEAARQCLCLPALQEREDFGRDEVSRKQSRGARITPRSRAEKSAPT